MATLTNNIEQRESLLDAWVAKRRQIAVLEAEASTLLADRLRLLDEDVREQPHHRETIHRSMIAEYSAAGRLSKGSIEYAFTDAHFLDTEHPAVRDAFHRGVISAAHVREIVREGMVVRQAVRDGQAVAQTTALYDTAALVVAEHDSPARTRATVRQIASSLAGETVLERHTRARGERSVTVRSLDDGLAMLQVVLPEHLAHAILDRLTRLAQHVIETRADREPILPLDLLDSGADPVFLQDLVCDTARREDPALNDHGLDPRVIFGEGSTFTTDPRTTSSRSLPTNAASMRSAPIC